MQTQGAEDVPSTDPISPPGQLFSLGLLLFHHQPLVLFQQVCKARPGIKLVKRRWAVWAKCNKCWRYIATRAPPNVHTYAQTYIHTWMYVSQLACVICWKHPVAFWCWYLSVCMSSHCGYLRSPASPIIDFEWKVSHCACRGWRGKPLKWFLCVSRLSKAFHTGFYSQR